MPHTQYDIDKIAKAIKGQLIQHAKKPSPPVQHLLLDSRKISYPESSLFFAIKGKRHNGHEYIGEVYQKGIRNFIISEQVNLNSFPDASFVVVKNTVQALQQLAAVHRSHFKIPIIGITGSNGKTIVKEWINQLLETDFRIIRSPKSYNSQIGVPLSVWLMNDAHSLGIFEAGISEPGEMDLLEKIIKPTIGIFTNIGSAHSEGFLNLRHKVKEKLKLFVNSDILIYCKDHKEINSSIAEINQVNKKDGEIEEKFRLFTWSKSEDADVRITEIQKAANSTKIDALFDDESISIQIPFADDASIENAIHCLALMLYLGLGRKMITGRFKMLGTVAMRLELKDAVNNCSLINDSYSSDLNSLTIALDFLGQQQQHVNKTIILSDILQSGKDEQSLYDEVLQLLNKKNITRFIGIGEALMRRKKIFEDSGKFSIAFYKSTDDFLKMADADDFRNETILLKGARPFEFEKISKMLEQKIHETVLEINLNALAHNLNVYHSLLKPETRIMAMVKASSYGSGSFEIANLLQFHRVHYLTVAYADEGVELRKAGITLPVMVMNPEERSFESMIAHNLEPEIYSLSLLSKYAQAVVNSSIDEKGKTFPVHIKLDTGMHRLGFEEKDLTTLLAELKKSNTLKVSSIFSHLSGSDDPQHDDFSRFQINRFEKMSNELANGLGYRPLRHILNTGGMVRFPDAQFDMVRLGLGLYGIDTTGKIQDKLQNVSTLKTTISQIKCVPANESVGYGRKWTSETETRVATVGIGYADGYDRRLSNGMGKMLIRGKIAPVIGNICMDMCMIDVTKIPEAEEGDEVIVFGNELPIDKIAAQTGTIPYEILTGISSRVRRVYYQE